MTDAPTDHASIDENVTSRQEMSGWQAMTRTQPFWVLLAIIVIGVVMTFVSDVFFTERNMFNVTRNFAFFGIMALGMSAVICTAGIDLSVGSLMGLAGIVAGLVMQAGFGNAYRQAVEPYRAEFESGEMSIIVADTLPMQMEQLKDGLSNGQVGQRPFEMGYQAMFVLKDLIDGTEVEDPMYTGLDVCTQDNADSCIAQ